MYSCTFFGHRKCWGNIEPVLEQILKDLIENRNVSQFYVGNQGQFDMIVYHMLEKLKSIYPEINYNVVLAYMPKNRESEEITYYKNTLLPDGIEEVFPKFAISFRNRWMVNKCDYVVGYIENSFGGAYQFFEMAKKKGKTVINIADLI